MSFQLPRNEAEVPGWGDYREWFRREWAAGGTRAWLVALGNVGVGLLLFAVVALLPIGAGGGFLALANVILLALALYVATAPPAEPYIAWLEEKWVKHDPDKLFIILGHATVAFFLMAVLLGLPFNGFMGAIASVLFFTAVYAMMVLALNLHWGYAGIFNIGVAGFMAVGVYAMAIATTTPNPSPPSVPGLGLPLGIGILVGMFVAAVVGLLAALPALRLRADYFAIVTVALSEIIRISLKSTSLQRFEIAGVVMGTGGATGKTMPNNPLRLLFFEGHDPGATPALLGTVLFPLFRDLRIVLIPPNTFVDVAGVTRIYIGFVLDLAVQPTVITKLTYIVILFGFVGLFYWLLTRVGNSPFGRVLKAIREDEMVAQSLGKDTRVFKLVSFTFGCALMGLGGILWIGSQGFTNPSAFKPLITFYIWIALIIGGAGSNTGSVLGAALFASALWTGPVYLKSVIESYVDLGATPGNIIDAIVAIGSGQLVPIFAYLMDNIANLRLVFIGALLVWLMQNRPEGMLGHRKEEAAAISLGRPGGEEDE